MEWAQPPLRVYRLRILNYRGIGEFDKAIPQHGAILRGKNAQGKTSVLRAIRAALLGQDIQEDAIHINEDRAEVLVDCGAITSERVIKRGAGGKKGSTTLTVKDGPKKVEAPQAFLKSLFGNAAIDPLDLYLVRSAEDRKKRKDTILAALPVVVTREHVARWLADMPTLLGPAASIADTIDYSAHGLTVVAELHGHVYAMRGEKNAELKKASADVEHARVAWTNEEAVLQKLPPPGMRVAGVDDARKLRDSAHEAVNDLARRQERAKSFEERTAKTRAEVAALRKSADECDAKLAAQKDTTELISRLAATSTSADNVAVFIGRIETGATSATPIRELLVDAKSLLQSAREAVAAAERVEGWLSDTREEIDGLEARRDHERNRADELEGAIKGLAEDPVTPEAYDNAVKYHASTMRALAHAEQAAKVAAARQVLDDARTREKELGDLAGRLSGVVDRLAKEAPNELLAESDGIEGLGISGDDITFNGVGIDTLSGAEQLEVAVEIARRAAKHAKIIIADGLERLDPEAMVDFVRHVTRDGYQLIGTRVDAGDVVLEAITLEDAP